jgi:hypothetical protein
VSSADLTLQEVFAIAIGAALPSVPSGSHPPADRPLPYIQFGQSEVVDEFPPGHELFIDVHVWSKAEGPHQVKEYQDGIRTALHDQAFSRGDWRFTCVRENNARTFLDVDNETWHGVQRFRALAGLL